MSSARPPAFTLVPFLLDGHAVPGVVKIATPDAAAELAGLPLEATVAMADVAAAMREGCWRSRPRRGWW